MSHGCRSQAPTETFILVGAKGSGTTKAGGGQQKHYGRRVKQLIIGLVEQQTGAVSD